MMTTDGNGVSMSINMWTGQNPERESPYESCSKTLLGFGDFKGWRYGGIPTDRPHYVAHLWTEHEVSRPEKKMATDWLKLTEYSIVKDVFASS